MKKQKQNISASIGDNQENNVNQASNTQTTDLISHKRDRDKESSENNSQKQELFSLDISPNLNLNLKKQKYEENLTQAGNPHSNPNLTTNNGNYNIINNSHTGNINVNINNYMGNVQNDVYPNMQINNYRQVGIPSQIPTPTYNLYQNLAQYNKNMIPGIGGNVSGVAPLTNMPSIPGGTFSYSSYYGNNSNMNQMGNIYTSRYSNPGTNFTQTYNAFNSNLYNSHTNPNLGVNTSINQSSASEKKKYEIKVLPEMTVGNYLLNKNVQDMYLNSISTKKIEDETGAEVLSPRVKNLQEGKNFILNNEIKTDNNGNNIILESKSVPAQLNKAMTNAIPATSSASSTTHNFQPSLNKVVNYTTIGNVITFNKTPMDTSYYNENITQSQISNDLFNRNMHPPVSDQNIQSGNIIKNTNIINIPAQKVVQQPVAKNTKSGEFSVALQKYIQRAYEKCKDEFDRNKCQKALMKIMENAFKKGDLDARNWDNYPLPVLPSAMRDEVKIEKNISAVTEQEMKNREKRKGRFELKVQNEKNSFSGNSTTPNSTLEELTKHIVIVGTCQTLEKQYLRLTSIPDPSQVRPEYVLKKSLQMLKDKWKKKEGDYNYISEQFRSIRQDMTIQHIQDEFTVKVYETHARIALESLDLDQFNQCQTALISLYQKGIKGSQIEFLAYRIIYTILQGIKYDMENLLRDIYSDEKKNGIISKNYEISHALKVMKAINSHNYFEFFKLFKITPNMGSFLIEPFLPRLRINALQVACVGYFTEIYLSFLCEKLAFESRDEFLKFLEENNVVLSKDNNKIIAKDSLPALNSSKLLAVQFKVSPI